MENIYENFHIEDDEEKIWKDCVFVFDTSALLNFYRFSKEARKDIFDNIFNNLEDRLWIPGHVEYEYFKNREKAINGIVKDKYKSINQEHIENINKFMSNISNHLENLHNKTKDKDTHPYIESEIILKFDKEFEKFNKKYENFRDDLDKLFKSKIEEIEQLHDDDLVLKKFKEYFEVGKQYKFDEMVEIIKEGKLRYEIEMPPGYKDYNKDSGLQKYGDLFIWKQIISYSLEKRECIIFITDDEKEDWWLYEDEKNKVKYPKHDLIKEIHDKAKVYFWMYDLSQFVYKSKKYIAEDVSDETIKEAENIKRERRLYSLIDKSNKNLRLLSPTEEIVFKWLMKYRKFEDAIVDVKEYDGIYDEMVNIVLTNKNDKSKTAVSIKRIFIEDFTTSYFNMMGTKIIKITKYFDELLIFILLEDIIYYDRKKFINYDKKIKRGISDIERKINRLNKHDFLEIEIKFIIGHIDLDKKLNVIREL